MINQIKAALNSENICVWKIVERTVISRELFFVFADVDMNRAKEVTHYDVTVYADFEEDGKKYRGSAKVALSQGMTEQEMRDKLRTAFYAAGFAKNPWYPLAESSKEEICKIESSFAAEDNLSAVEEIVKAIYGVQGVADKINAVEVFVEKWEIRILNSDGVDVCFEKYKGQIEVVTHAEKEDLSVEVARIYDFADSCPEVLQKKISSQLQETEWRLHAKSFQERKDIPVILSNEAVADFFDYYIAQAQAQMVFKGISQTKIGDNFQGDVKGDTLTLTLLPMLKNSSESANFDNDGVFLKEVTLFQEGKVMAYHGSRQYCSYLNTQTTGNISNFKVEAGSMSYAEMTAKPHIELLVFSDFQANQITGDIGGEVRLARYFDGQEYHMISGVSMAASIPSIQNNIYFSKEITQHNHYLGPAHIYFPSLTIA